MQTQHHLLLTWYALDEVHAPTIGLITSLFIMFSKSTKKDA